jgi:hypothetical protein
MFHFFFAVFLNPSRGYLLSRLQYSIGRMELIETTPRDTHLLLLLFIIFIQTALKWELKEDWEKTNNFLLPLHYSLAANWKIWLLVP